MSDCTTYYSEYDPFDYLYSGSGTQYSDPVYEAVIRSDQTPMSPGSSESLHTLLSPVLTPLPLFQQSLVLLQQSAGTFLVAH